MSLYSANQIISQTNSFSEHGDIDNLFLAVFFDKPLKKHRKDFQNYVEKELSKRDIQFETNLYELNDYSESDSLDLIRNQVVKLGLEYFLVVKDIKRDENIYGETYSTNSNYPTFIPIKVHKQIIHRIDVFLYSGTNPNYLWKASTKVENKINGKIIARLIIDKMSSDGLFPE